MGISHYQGKRRKERCANKRGKLLTFLKKEMETRGISVFSQEGTKGKTKKKKCCNRLVTSSLACVSSQKTQFALEIENWPLNCKLAPCFEIAKWPKIYMIMRATTLEENSEYFLVGRLQQQNFYKNREISYKRGPIQEAQNIHISPNHGQTKEVSGKMRSQDPEPIWCPDISHTSEGPRLSDFAQTEHIFLLTFVFQLPGLPACP